MSASFKRLLQRSHSFTGSVPVLLAQHTSASTSERRQRRRLWEAQKSLSPLPGQLYTKTQNPAQARPSWHVQKRTHSARGMPTHTSKPIPHYFSSVISPELALVGMQMHSMRVHPSGPRREGALKPFHPQ